MFLKNYIEQEASKQGASCINELKKSSVLTRGQTPLS